MKTDPSENRTYWTWWKMTDHCILTKLKTDNFCPTQRTRRLPPDPCRAFSRLQSLAMFSRSMQSSPDPESRCSLSTRNCLVPRGSFVAPCPPETALFLVDRLLRFHLQRTGALCRAQKEPGPSLTSSPHISLEIFSQERTPVNHASINY